MRIKMSWLLLLGVHSSVFANVGYEVQVTVKKLELELVFPAFQIMEPEQIGTAYVDGCAYVGKLTVQDEESILLKADMSCDDVDFSREMPIFVLSSKGERVSYELVGDDKIIWEYSVEVKTLK
ncbi:hypothetical protein [Vibrio sp. F74]|uniref:hypothetical protein n=1 Tax=Vibrio sp. F74 TaxID=700020 RepID=UPI0035F57C14